MALQKTRRGVIVAATGVLLSGCSLIESGNSENSPQHSDTGQIREVIVTNDRTDTVQLAVRVDTEEGNDFSNVYSLSPDEYDAGDSVDGVPQSVTVFTADGQYKQWENIETSSMNCDAPDIEIVVNADNFDLNDPC